MLPPIAVPCPPIHFVNELTMMSCAVINGTQQIWCGEGCIDDQRNAVFMGNVSDFLYIRKNPAPDCDVSINNARVFSVIAFFKNFSDRADRLNIVLMPNFGRWRQTACTFHRTNYLPETISITGLRNCHMA